MASKSRPRAFNTSRSYAKGFLYLLLTLCGGAWSGAIAATAPGEVSSLRPYTAQYNTQTRGLELTLTRRLKTGADGTYTLTNGGKIMVVGFHEVSVFKVEQGRVVPKSYVYQGTGLINRRREVHFIPGADTIRSLYKDQWYDLPRSDATLDRMSQLEQLRLLLLNNRNPGKDIMQQVADGKRVKEYHLVFVGEEILQTPAGPIRTVHFERLHDDPQRKSDTWLAPDWDYLMIKTVHIEDDKLVEVTLDNASLDGIQVTGQ